MPGHLRQFAIFCAVGGAGLVVNLVITHVGVLLGAWYLYAFVVGLLVSWSCSFVLNAFVTFPEHERARYLRKYLLYLGNYGLVFLLNVALMYALTSLLGIHYLISIVVCAVSTTLLTYSLSKHVIYHP